MRRLVASGFGLVALLSAMNARAHRPSTASKISLEEVTATDGYTLGRPFAVRPLSDGRTVLYLRSEGDSRTSDLWSMDVETGEERRLLSASDLLGGAKEELSAEEKARRERLRIRTSGFASYQLTKDEDRLLVKLSGDLYVHELATGHGGRVELPDGVVIDPQWRPDGGAIAFVLDHDLCVAEIEFPKSAGAVIRPHVIRLTDDGSERTPRGLAEFVAQEEMSRMHGYWWSPDGQRIAFQLSDATGVEELTVADAAYPEQPVTTFAYPRPGKNNVDVRLAVIEAKAGAARRVVGWDRRKYPYLARVAWASADALGMLVQSRDQHEQVWLKVEASSSNPTATALVFESEPTWINLAHGAPRWVDDGKAYIWATEAEGAWQLERHVASSGAEKNVQILVEPDAGLFAVAHVDEAHDRVWFVGGSDPTQQHLFFAPLSRPGAATAVTSGEAYNSAAFARDGRLVAITRASLTELPETTVHTVDAAGQLGPAVAIPHRAKTPPALPNIELVPPENAGGFHAMLVRPLEAEPGQQFPVVLYVYGGPHVNVVQAMAHRFFVQQFIADHGFIVVSIDGRGTPRRGRDFERAIDLRFGDVPLADQVAGLEALGASYPELDTQRVGIYGWSFGGYMSALAVLDRPDVFLAGVAGAPVTEWLYYDTHYTERYLGVPTEDEKPYRDASLVPRAERLKRPLMLVHGIADDNVYFAHSLQLVKALFEHGKSFELLPLVGLTHQLSDPGVRQKLFDRIVSFFEGHLGAPCRIGS